MSNSPALREWKYFFVSLTTIGDSSKMARVLGITMSPVIRSAKLRIILNFMTDPTKTRRVKTAN